VHSLWSMGAPIWDRMRRSFQPGGLCFHSKATPLTRSHCPYRLACCWHAQPRLRCTPAALTKIKLLSPAKDPTRGTVLVDRNVNDGLTTTLEIEGAEAMWMQMGAPPMWREHAPAKGERFHIEVKTTDNKTRTRLPYAIVTFNATNRDSGKVVLTILPPMSGSKRPALCGE